MEKDDDIKGDDNSYDFGARMYDPRVGRWFAPDELFKKYADLSPYAFSNNNPILFVDYDGNDFGVIINHNTKQIMIVNTIFTTSIASYNEAVKAAQQWNNKSATVEGYKVAFFINVLSPSKGNFTNTQLASNSRVRFGAASAESSTVEASSVYAGADGPNSKNVYSNAGSFVGGFTSNGKIVSMNTDVDNYGYLGSYDDFVAHEFGHLFGLDDEDGNKDGKTDKYFSDRRGIMFYAGLSLFSVSDYDVATILTYASDVLNKNESTATSAKVYLISEEGTPDNTFTLCLTKNNNNETKDLPVIEDPE